MRKPISPRMHGVLDYTTVAAVAALPAVLDMPARAKGLFYGLAGGYLGLSLMTNYPLGAKKKVPFKGHGAAEGVIGAALPAMPWALGFQDDRVARNLCLGLAAFTGVVAALTDWS